MRRALVAVLLAAAAATVAAQYGAGGQRKSMIPDRSREDAKKPEVRGVPDPMIAIERELPSLAADLQLAPEQREPWRAFERAVRDVAELSRQRAKKLLAQRPLDAPSVEAGNVLTALADDDRMRADAMADCVARFKAVQATLTLAQKSMLDRRVTLALSEPLGLQ